MNTLAIATLVAKIAALLYLSISLGILIEGKYYQEQMSKALDNPGFLYLGGFMALTFGMLILHVHNIWEKDWTVLVTLIGWIALIKGLWLLIFPRSIEGFKPLLKHLHKLAILPLILGVVFGYFGFFAG